MNTNTNGKLPSVDPDVLLSVTLEAQQWNVILSALSEVSLPYRLTSPIINSTMVQLSEAVEKRSGGEKPEKSELNGAGTPPPDGATDSPRNAEAARPPSGTGKRVPLN